VILMLLIYGNDGWTSNGGVSQENKSRDEQARCGWFEAWAMIVSTQRVEICRSIVTRDEHVAMDCRRWKGRDQKAWK
jgi:fructosamine-3-kinase